MMNIPKNCRFCANTENREKCPKCKYNPKYDDYFKPDPKVLSTVELFEHPAKKLVEENR